MIRATVYGKVIRAAVSQERPNGLTVATIGLDVNAGGDFVRVNGVAQGELAVELLRLQVGDMTEICGPIQPRVHVDTRGTATATFDVSIRELSRPSANRGNQA